MQRGLGVGAVQGFAAAMGFETDRISGRDECGDVGDRVVHTVTVSVALDEHGLVQVHRIRRIDGDESDIGAVLVGQARIRGGIHGNLFDFRPKPGREAEFALQAGHAAGQCDGLRRRQTQAACRGHR